MASVDLGYSKKAKIALSEVPKILFETYSLQCSSITELNGYVDNNYHVTAKKHNNRYITSESEHGYVLKIMNLVISKELQYFEAVKGILEHLEVAGICCPKIIHTVNGECFTTHRLPSGSHLVWLLEFISGSIFYKVPASKILFYEAGEYLAKLDKAMKNFDHHGCHNRNIIWTLDNIPQISHFLYAVADESKVKIAKEVIEEFSRRVLPANLERGIIHGDFSDQNILVEKKEDRWVIKGILDFTCIEYGCYLYELGITMMYLIFKAGNIDVGGYILAGYTSVRKLSVQEYSLLKLCVAARFSQSLVMGAFNSLQDPENSYILTTASSGWRLLEELWAIPEQRLLDHWKTLGSELLD